MAARMLSLNHCLTSLAAAVMHHPDSLSRLHVPLYGPPLLGATLISEISSASASSLQLRRGTVTP